MTRVLVAVAWASVVVMAVALAAQVGRWSERRRLVVAVQAVTPYLLLLAVPIAIAAVVASRWSLAAVAGGAVASLIGLARPLWAHEGRTPAAPGTPTLRVFHGNLLYHNDRPGDLAAALAPLHADVLALTEYAPRHAEALRDEAICERFPHRIEHPEPTAGGSAIWSRHPLVEVASPPSLYRSSAAVVDGPVRFELHVVHPPNPFVDHDDWLAELDGLAELHRRRSGATLVVGDLNASYWHPPFRQLLAAGWRDAHQVAGRGASTSWPTDRWWLPAFVRLDHALVDDSLAVTSVQDVDVPGSDHRGFVVAVTSVDAR